VSVILQGNLQPPAAPDGPFVLDSAGFQANVKTPRPAETAVEPPQGCVGSGRAPTPRPAGRTPYRPSRTLPATRTASATSLATTRASTGSSATITAASGAPGPPWPVLRASCPRKTLTRSDVARRPPGATPPEPAGPDWPTEHRAAVPRASVPAGVGVRDSSTRPNERDVNYHHECVHSL
jgi:hypothetical protein